ncbi:regulatory protein GemA [Vibrio parahaemolyticus]|nr:regulatory protein GemA [Vibrio parahaemolyticus]MCR9653259.1 regulatory protein GemA [Vibrio parahaemolyticus]
MAYLGKTRKQLIQLIHVGKTQLGMDDETYRAMLQGIIGVSSAKDANWTQLESVLEHMNRLGFKPVRKRSPKSGQARSRITDALRALWISMHKQGFIEDGSEPALRAWIIRMLKIDSPQWLTDYQAMSALESLKQWHKRMMVVKLGKPHLKSSSYQDVLDIYHAEQVGGGYVESNRTD